MFLRSFLCAGLLAMAAAAPGSAQVPDGHKQIAWIKLADLKAIVQSQEHSLVATGDNGPHSLTAKDSRGVTYQLIGKACGKLPSEPCSAILLQIRYTANANVTLEKINAANQRFDVVKTYLAADRSTFIVERYFDLNYGVPFGNIDESVMVALITAQAISGQVAAP
jgi:hypothetical protein